jgi:Lrp/AsnC family transcriptional regulator, leucine-responsive regulatory protein
MHNVDATDLQILTLLQPDARMSNAALAKELGMAPSAVLERVRKLETRGIIEAYTTQINPQSMDLRLLSFVSIKASTAPGDTQLGAQLAAIPEIQELHIIAGEDCFLAKVRTSDAQALVTLMRDKLGKINGVVSTKTTIVLQTIKEKNHLVIPPSL